MKIRLIFLFLSVSLVAKAQFPVYFIDLYMGDVQIIKPGKKPAPVKTHMLVFPDDKILIKKDGAKPSRRRIGKKRAPAESG